MLRNTSVQELEAAEDVEIVFDELEAETLDDVSGQQELKGILIESLGDFPFKCAILLIVFFNLIYTFYHAFFATRIDYVIESDCYCDPTDRAFYIAITLSSVIIWICILCGYAVISTFGHGHFIRFNEAKQNKHDKSVGEKNSELSDKVTAYEKSFQGKLRDIVSAKLLDYDYCKAIEDYYQYLYNQSIELNTLKDATMTTDQEETTATTMCADATDVIADTSEDTFTDKQLKFEYFYNKKGRKQPTRWWCYMWTKILLIVLRFMFRLLIVPLLQLQWFNEYAWNCLMNNVIRNYCETNTSQYYIGLDHTFVLYSVYIILLIALLFSLIINWFPQGIPEVTFQYKTQQVLIKNFKVNINKKGQFSYHKLTNEESTENETIHNDATEAEQHVTTTI